MERTHDEWRAAFKERLRRSHTASPEDEPPAIAPRKRARSQPRSYDGPGWSVEKSKRGAASCRKTLEKREQALLHAGVKTCATCKVSKPLAQFPMRAKNESQVPRSVCRECAAEARRARRRHAKESDV